MHNLTLYTEKNWVNNVGRNTVVDVKYKIYLDPERKDLDPSQAFLDVGVIQVQMPFVKDAGQDDLLVCAESAAAVAIVMKAARHAFGGKKNPQHTALLINTSQALTAEALNKPNMLYGHEKFSSFGFNFCHFAAAYLLGASYAFCEAAPEWVETKSESFYKTTPNELRHRAAIKDKGYNFTVTTKALHEYTALPHLGNDTMTRPYNILRNKILTAIRDGRMISRVLRGQPIPGKERKSYIVNDFVMVTSRRLDQNFETIIKIIPWYKEETREKYEGQFEENLSNIIQELDFSDY